MGRLATAVLRLEWRLGVVVSRMADTALEWFLADAKRQGLSLAEYERRYDLILSEGALPSPAAQRIRRHELLGGLMRDGEIVAVTEREARIRQCRVPRTRSRRARRP